MSDGSAWPRITIVTPSYNQAEFVEETIRSVLLQGYPDLEYIIMDGGSTDGSVAIVERYAPWLAYWTSQVDAGQSDALNRGFSRATGAVFAYLNSDDVLEPGVLSTVAALLAGRSEPFLMAGECVVCAVNGSQKLFRPSWPTSLSYLLRPFGSPFAQPSAFWTRALHEAVEGFNAASHFAFDREFFLRAGLLGVVPQLVSRPLSRYRDHGATKTRQTIRIYQEAIPLIERYAGRCGLDARATVAMLRDCRDEIRYLDTFARWKHRGRLPALAFFVGAVARSPRMLCQRRVLGLARRLVTFPASAVAELQNV
jgi:glycosyltransferase involved in cell wall biosynthesis